MAAVSDRVDLSVEDGIAVLCVDNPPVNALSAGVRTGLAEGVTLANADDAVAAIVILCTGRTFIAGADITEFGAKPSGPSLHDVVATIESSNKPVVAGIHGTALGGGLETALGCNYRVADAGARFGLPEVKLGLLPGCGGTQRLPRIVGVERALQMVTSGEQIGAEEALTSGLISEVVADLRAGTLAFARKVVADNLPLLRVRDMNEKLEAARGKPEIFSEFRKSIARKTRGFEAPEQNIRCIEIAVESDDFDTALKQERQLFTALLEGEQAAAQQYFFFAERQAAKVPDIPKDTPEIEINKVGIVGAGTMGGGIAMNMLNIGIPVTIVEASQAALDRGLAVIRKNYERSVKSGRITQQDVEDRMALLTPTLNLDDLADCDLVIEAVFEDMGIKKEIFEKLDGIVKAAAILASNTSRLDINEIAAVTRRPESVIGLHFFSPANVMKLLEVVRGDKTSKEVIKTCMSFSKKIGKVAALVGVCHGFVGNRILGPRHTQAAQLILEGAMPQQVDKVLFDFGMPMGPFQMEDLAGLDIGWSAATSKGDSVKSLLCEAGRRGQKNRKGYYDYDDHRNRSPSPEADKIIADFAAAAGRPQRDIDDGEILERCTYPMINEGAKILEEGIAIRSSDIDVIWVYGYGWPVYRGGPMHYADSIGLDKVVVGLRKFQEATGDPAWEPAALLKRLAEEGKGFADYPA